MQHIHAKLMEQYAKDALTTDKPWELWEFSINNGAEWRDIYNQSPSWTTIYTYRRKEDKPEEIELVWFQGKHSGALLVTTKGSPDHKQILGWSDYTEVTIK